MLDYIGSLKLIFVKAKTSVVSKLQTENFSAAKHLLILEKAAGGLSRADQVSFVIYNLIVFNLSLRPLAVMTGLNNQAVQKRLNVCIYYQGSKAKPFEVKQEKT